MNKYILVTITSAIAVAVFFIYRRGQVKPASSVIKRNYMACQRTFGYHSTTPATFKITVTKSKGTMQEMVFVKGGAFQMGSDEFNDAKPVHKVLVSSFYMDVHEVTNAAFAEFVKATGYITTAERVPRKEDYPDVPVDNLVRGSAVFSPPSCPVSLNNPMQWWRYVAGANWKHPHGAKSSISGKDNEPVVQVSYTDAVAYAKWAGKRLPTEAEWEYAARAGHQYKEYYWGNELKQNDKWTANIFQGDFPYRNNCDDGFAGIAPVKSFPANSFGLYDMEGNVWEWCSDLYSFDFYERSPDVNPKGPAASDDPDEPDLEKHVQRGGSFLCSDQYCERYKAGSRGNGETSSAGDNLGFRCVKDVVMRK